MPFDFKKFEELTGISFKDKRLLKQAFTHSSYANVHSIEDDNERLEFLGDSILNLVISDYLYERYPDFDEGKLSRMKSALVNRDTLFSWGKTVELGEFMFLSREEEAAGGREKDSIIANAFEALIAAIYRDQGYLSAKYFIIGMISQQEKIERMDFKSILQEAVQKKYKILPEYGIKQESGPDHEKIFEIEVKVKNRTYGRGVGKSKKDAQQQAAKEALEKMKML